VRSSLAARLRAKILRGHRRDLTPFLAVLRPRPTPRKFIVR